MKKMIISEEEKGRILEMHKDATKRHYLGEQTSPSQSTPAKPTFENNGVAYYIPGLDGGKFNSFTDTQYTLANGDMIAFSDFMKNSGAKWGEKSVNPLAYGKDTYNQQMEIYTQKLMKGMSPSDAMKDQPILQSLSYLSNLLSEVNTSYLKNWSPDSRGVAVLSKPEFMNDPNVIQMKKTISNFDTIYPQILNALSAKTGLKIS